MKRQGLMLLLFGLLLLMTLVAGVGNAQLTDAQRRELELDLSVLDDAMMGAPTPHQMQDVLETVPLRAQDRYKAYMLRASAMTQELMLVKRRMDASGGQLSLQQLGGYVSALRSENLVFSDRLEAGETQYQSYRLIQTAVNNLDDALTHWRMANRYRRTFRGSQLLQDTDDEVLQIKMQRARQALESLNVILDANEALTKNVQYEFDR